MTPEQIERVFGRGRLKMATGEHVEVFREAVARGERRRYTKRFLSTREGDFGQWTEREWRILARLIGHGIACVPDVVQFDRGRQGGVQLVQTYDAGVTVDQWATLLPVSRDERVHRHVFEDSAHWWALAHHCLLALNVIHALELVHLDIKGDNVCIPYAPASFDPDSADLRLQPVFAQLALIDFAFALISRESLTTPLPIGWQKDYDYQSPRLLAALEAGRNGELQQTRELDWRCDMYSLAAMLKRYLPDESVVLDPSLAAGWTTERYDAAKALILRIRDCHDGELPAERPHAALIEQSATRLREHAFALSLERGWTLAREANVSPASASPLTPVTRLVPVTRIAAPMVTRSGRITAVTVIGPAQPSQASSPIGVPAAARQAAQLPSARSAHARVLPIALIALGAVGGALSYLAHRALPSGSETQAFDSPTRAVANQTAPKTNSVVEWNKDAQEADTRAAPAVAVRTVREASAALRSPPADKAVLLSTPPESGAAENSARGAPPGSTTEAEPTPAAIAPLATETASAPAAPASETLRAAPAASLPQQPTMQAPAATTRKSAAAAAVKQASAPPRPASKLSASSSAKAPTATDAGPARPAPQARRTHAWWASLEPPAWLRTGNPPDPPGMKAQELRREQAVASTEVPASPPTPALGASQRAELAPSAPSLTPAAATSSAGVVVAGLSTGDPPRALSGTFAPPAQPSATSATGDDKAPTVTPKPALRGARSAVPIEDRSDAVALALARPAPSLREPRERIADAGQRPPDDFAAQGRRTLLDTVPRVAARAEPEVARVLWMAASSYHPSQERALAAAARATRIPDDGSLFGRTAAPGEARRLNDEARAVYASRRNVPEAFDLQLRAFGANPADPEVAGNLASLYLRTMPPQPELARQVALYALAARGPQFHSARMEDWYTYAVASALAGRESDATNALFVTLALSADLERRCAAALNALAIHGARLRKPVEAMLSRIHAQGRDYDAPACAWPPSASTLSRLP